MDPMLQQAQLAAQLGDIGRAEGIATAVLANRRNDLDAIMLLVRLAMATSRLPRAIELQSRAVEVQPRHAGLRVDLANMYLDNLQIDKALVQFEKALKLEPANLQAISGTAFVASLQGKQDRLRRILAPSLAHEAPPPETAFLCIKVLVADGRLDDAVAMGRRVVAGEHPPTQYLRSTWFELARALEKNGDYPGAFEAATQGNAIFAYPFDADAHRRWVDALIETFTPELLASLPRPEEPTDVPVFLVGAPRCGSTLTERVIHAHPEAHGIGEHMSLFRMAGQISAKIGSMSPYPLCVRELQPEHVEALADEYMDAITPLAPLATRIANKDLGNVSHLGLIAVLFPKGRIIHCRRDAVDTCLSCYMEPLPPGAVTFANDLTALGTYYREYERLMEHWRTVLDVPMLDLDYETLVADQEATTRRIIEFCDLPWDDACLKFHEVRRAERTQSLDQVRKPLYGSSVGRAERFGALLDPLREALGR
ncbi:MAG: tetratricopeptide repeat-containing sulfotransferase family protein [Planctomycetota bacterium]|jgi:tetratricopeptide (TPR) repeat protein